MFPSPFPAKLTIFLVPPLLPTQTAPLACSFKSVEEKLLES